MMPNSSAEQDLFPLSWLSQYGYCPRRCGLLAIDGAWEENADTAAGRVEHKRVHTARTQQRGGVFYLYELGVFSRSLSISGKCDCVEAHPAENGVFLPYGEGRYTLYPVEYKHGVVRDEAEYHLQLCAQAMCLEEQFGGNITHGALFFIDAHRRDEVELTETLRQKVEKTAHEIRTMIETQRIPQGRYSAKCRRCSLLHVCEPKLKRSSDNYCRAVWQAVLEEGET